MNMLKQCRDNFQCGGKDELNLKLTFFIMTNFFRNLEVLNPGIKSVKNIWNLKQVWITPKNLSHFHSFCEVFIKNQFMRNDISNITLQEIALFFYMMLSFSQVNFGGICIHWNRPFYPYGGHIELI